MPGTNLIYSRPQTSGRSEKAAVVVDWTILFPAFLTAVVERAGAVVTVLAVDPGPREEDLRTDALRLSKPVSIFSDRAQRYVSGAVRRGRQFDARGIGEDERKSESGKQGRAGGFCK